jgi:hypothetical protein
MTYPVISPVKLIGSLVYRTREALNKNPCFPEQIKQYEFYDAITDDEGKIQLWHYPGTVEEISKRYLSYRDFASCKLKFPAVFNYQGTSLRKSGGLTTIRFDLVFVAPVDSLWTTVQQDDNVFSPVLRDICAEFFNQVKKHRHFRLPVAGLAYELHEIYLNNTKTAEDVQKTYGEHMNAIQVAGLQLPVADICEKELLSMEEENKKVIITYQ